MLGWLLKSRRNKGDAAAAGAHVSAGLQHHQAGRLRDAEREYAEALGLDPECIDALHFSGVIAYQQERHDDAQRLISRALSLDAANPPAHNNLGNVLLKQGRLEDALASFERAIALQPDYLDAHVNLASVWLERARPERALECIGRALRSLPGAARLRLQRAQALAALGRHEEAAAAFREAIEADPASAAAYSGLGHALGHAGRPDEAIAAYRRAAALDPGGAGPRYDAGVVCHGIGRTDEALECFGEALAVDPEFAPARWALTTGQLPAVYADAAEPELRRAAFARELATLERWVAPERLAASVHAVGAQQPFYLAYQDRNNRELLGRHGALCARVMDAWLREERPASAARAARDRVRVGVVSAHFHNHSVWHAIIKGWLLQIDPDRFELDVFHLGSTHDAETDLARSRAAAFHAGPLTLRQWTEAILERRPDVLLYPDVGMEPVTVKLASLRLAPVQAAAWGHPETTGLPTVDCYLSGLDMEPAGADAHYTERLVALPHLGCWYEATGVEAEAPPVAIDVPPGAPLFVCPGVPFKYAPEHDAALAGIARALGRCRFVFFTHRPPELSERLRLRLEAAFRREGLDFRDFGVFAPWLPRGAFLGMLKAADAMLDTIGFSGFNTAMQAVEAGLPIVTVEGRFMRGRFASAILRRMEISELVARSADEYVAVATKLGRDAAYRRGLRERIEARRGILFGDRAPILALEAFLAEAAGR